MAKSLNPRQEIFCIEYVKSGSARGAAITAGYAESTADDAANWIKFNPKKPQLFRPCVAARVSELIAEANAAHEMDLEKLQRIRERIINGEEHDVSVSVKGEVIEHPPTLKDRLKAMDAWERLCLAQLAAERSVTERENSGITLDVPEGYAV